MSETEPTTADRDESDVESWVTLAMVPGVGPLLRRDLLEKFGTARAVLGAAPSQLREVPRLGPKIARAICKAEETIDVRSELERCRQHEISLLTPARSVVS